MVKSSTHYPTDLTSIIRKVQENVDEFFQHQVILQQNPYASKGKLIPATDILETTDSYVIVVELPGVNPEAIDISYVSNKIVIKGTRDQTPFPVRASFHQMEILFGRFERTICLPDPIPTDGISAEYDRAFLTLTIEKRPQILSKKKITIKKK